MWKFLLTFLISYGALHALVYHRIRVLLPEQRWVHGLAIGLFTLLVIAPVASFALERTGHEVTARMVAFIGFSWMAFVFVTAVLAIGLDLLDILMWAGRKLNSRPPARLKWKSLRNCAPHCCPDYFLVRAVRSTAGAPGANHHIYGQAS